MSFKDIINIILPPLNGVSSHITENYGAIRNKEPHGGVDFNYIGGQTGNNLMYPTIYSPVNGLVVKGPGKYGTISIMDMYGNYHEILHTQTQTVKVGDWVQAGDPIGTMGGRGPKGSNEYANHVHYQMKDWEGNLINPQGWWDKVTSVSHDAINDEKRGLIYSTRVKMSKFNILVEDTWVNLSPGMAVSVEIKTGKRRVIEYFLSPLIQHTSESLRER